MLKSKLPKLAVFLSLLVIAFFSLHQYSKFVEQKSNPVGSEPLEILVSVTHTMPEYSYPVWRPFCAQLQANPKASRFRVEWRTLMMSTSIKSTVFYDRSTGTLEYHGIGSSMGRGVDCIYCFGDVTDEK